MIQILRYAVLYAFNQTQSTRRRIYGPDMVFQKNKTSDFTVEILQIRARFIILHRTAQDSIVNDTCFLNCLDKILYVRLT